jgi:cytochrome c oxidase subunit 3
MANHEPQQDHGHGDHDHPKFLHHHFDTPLQQFDSDKLGMWLFLMTEILMFGGLFCAYAVYRANHPEIFIYAHQFLDKTLGGINTVVLITSSFTMAWAVRAAQLNQRKLLITLLALTLLGGFGFMGIKAVEYNEKWKHGLLWGERYVSPESHGEHGEAADGDHGTAEDEHETDAAPDDGDHAEPTPADAEHAAAAGEDSGDEAVSHETAGNTSEGDEVAAGEPGQDADSTAEPAEGQAPAEDQGLVIEASNIKPAADGPAGLAAGAVAETGHGSAETLNEPRNVRTFFAIYFAMTGLHALHVMAGMVVIFIMLVLSVKGRFNSDYYTPIDLTGLFWHLVDLIWIFLFPLLYLIH